MLLSLIIHLYSYESILSTDTYPVMVIDDPLGVYIFLTPEGTLMNIRTLPDVPVLSYKYYKKSPARWGYTDHMWTESPRFTLIISPPGTSRIILSIGSLIALF